MRLSLHHVVGALLLLFSALALIVPNLSNICLFLLVLAGIVSLLRPARLASVERRPTWRRYWPLFLSMTLPAVAVLLHHAGMGDFSFRDYDRPLRLAVFVFVFFAVRTARLEKSCWLSWAWVLAAVLSFGKTWWVTEGGSLPNSGSLGFMAGIAFSNMVLLLAVWLLLSLRGECGRLLLAAKVVAIVLACYVTFMIKTRGTWLALPFYAVFLVWYLRNLRPWQRLLIALLPLVLVGAAATQSGAVRERLYEVRSNLSDYATGTNRNTSVGQRLEIWRASWYMFEEHPLLGVGRENFKPELYRLAAEKRTSADIVELPHSHNAMLFQMALWGVGGLIALLMVYLVPLVYFFRELRHSDPRVRSYAAMGVTMCIGFWAFDLTDVMFFWVILNGFYAINLAIFLVCIDRCKADWTRAREHEMRIAGH